MHEQDREELHAAVARIAALEDFMREHTRTESARVKRLEEAHVALQAEVSENTKVTNATKADTKTLVDFVAAYKATKLVGGLASRLLMYVSLVGGGLAAIFVALKTGRLP
jgi:hypothetical protein